VLLCLLLAGLISSAQEALVASKLPLISNFIMDPDKSILTNTEKSNRHSTLLSALKASNLDDVLRYNGQFTVFAPSNMAFEKLSQLTIDKLMDPKNKEELKAILSYHIVAGKLSASTILRSMCSGSGEASFTTILGENLTATMKGLDIVLTDKYGNKAVIVTADANQSNGVIHEIDSVFLPASAL